MANSLRNELLRLPSMPSVGSLLRLYRLRALKQLSQNFLLQPSVIKKIVKSAGDIKNGLVCEIGPGPGGITRSLINSSPKYILLVEKDHRFSPFLESLEDAARNVCRVQTVYADILNFDMKNFFDVAYKKEWEDSPPNIHIIGNLPFDVSTILIINWLRDISLRQNVWSLGRVKMTLTFQKEVAERLSAPILSKKRCRMSVICQNYCDVRHAFTISGKAFVPKPDVDVGVVNFVPRITPVVALPFEMTEKVLRTIFSVRQKYIRNGVRNLFPEVARDKLTEELFAKADVDPRARSFQLSVEEYGRIVHAYNEICGSHPRIYEYDYRAPKLQRKTCSKDDSLED